MKACLYNSLLIFCIIEILSLHAQAQIFCPYPKDIFKIITIDSANMRVWYALNAIDLQNTKTYDDWQCLEIGQHISKCFSFFVYNSDSLCTEYGKKHPQAQSVPTWMGAQGKMGMRWSEYIYSEYFKDFATDTFTEYACMPLRLSKYNSQCSESIPKQEWTLEDDTATIAGYLCQKAICHFRGRNFTAWFAVDIPVSNGPWKFGGLPGLILKVYDNDKFYTFECINIDIYQNKIPIRIYENFIKFQKMKRNELLEFRKKIHKDYHAMAGYVLTGGGEVPMSVLDPHKNPLELE
jgi:GLPGLI family protein